MDKKVLTLEKSIEKPEVSSYFAERRTYLEDQHTSAKHIQIFYYKNPYNFLSW